MYFLASTVVVVASVQPAASEGFEVYEQKLAVAARAEQVARTLNAESPRAPAAYEQVIALMEAAYEALPPEDRRGTHGTNVVEWSGDLVLDERLVKVYASTRGSGARQWVIVMYTVLQLHRTHLEAMVSAGDTSAEASLQATIVALERHARALTLRARLEVPEDPKAPEPLPPPPPPDDRVTNAPVPEPKPEPKPKPKPDPSWKRTHLGMTIGGALGIGFGAGLIGTGVGVALASNDVDPQTQAFGTDDAYFNRQQRRVNWTVGVGTFAAAIGSGVLISAIVLHARDHRVRATASGLAIAF